MKKLTMQVIKDIQVKGVIADFDYVLLPVYGEPNSIIDIEYVKVVHRQQFKPVQHQLPDDKILINQ